MRLSGCVRAGGHRRKVELPANWNAGRVCLTVYQVAFILGVDVATVWRYVKTAPGFPLPHELGASGRRKVWLSDEVASWLESTPSTFGAGREFRDMVKEALRHPVYRKELLSYCVRMGVISGEFIERLLAGVRIAQQRRRLNID